MFMQYEYEYGVKWGAMDHTTYTTGRYSFRIEELIDIKPCH